MNTNERQRLLDNVKRSCEESAQILVTEIKRTGDQGLAEELFKAVGHNMSRWLELKSDAWEQLRPLRHGEEFIHHLSQDPEHNRTCFTVFRCTDCKGLFGSCVKLHSFETCDNCWHGFP